MNRFFGQFLTPSNPLLPSDWVTIFYLAFTALLIGIFRRNLACWWMYLSVHVSLIIGVFSLAFISDGALSPPLQILRDWYPLTTILIFYWEVPPLTQMIFQGYHDDKIIGWEHRLFKGQPSMDLSKRFPSKVLSEFLHLCYVSYYGIAVSLAAVLYFQGKRAAFHETVFAEIFTFNICLIWYIFMPVTGPRYNVEKIKGTLADGFFYRLTHAIVSRGSAKGTAFPSSHAAIAMMVVFCAARYDPISFIVLCPLGVGLVIGTVYGRFHYAVDAISGTILASAVFALVPPVYRLLS